MQRQKHESCTDCGRRQVKSSVQVGVLLSIFSISCLFATEIPRLYKKRSEFLNPQLMFRNSYRISDPSLRQEVVDRKWAVKCQSNFLCEKPWSNEFLTLHLILGTPVKIISLKANEILLCLDLSHQKVVDINPRTRSLLIRFLQNNRGNLTRFERDWERKWG